MPALPLPPNYSASKLKYSITGIRTLLFSFLLIDFWFSSLRSISLDLSWHFESDEMIWSLHFCLVHKRMYGVKVWCGWQCRPCLDRFNTPGHSYVGWHAEKMKMLLMPSPPCSANISMWKLHWVVSHMLQCDTFPKFPHFCCGFHSLICPNLQRAWSTLVCVHCLTHVPACDLDSLGLSIRSIL